jgi:hypothetical protein
MIDPDVTVKTAPQILRAKPSTAADLEHTIESLSGHRRDGLFQPTPSGQSRARGKVLGAVTLGDGIEELAIRIRAMPVHFVLPA